MSHELVGIFIKDRNRGNEEMFQFCHIMFFVDEMIFIYD
jgi:hypothetical protein